MQLDILKEIKQPVFYVTNDPGRGIGLENFLPNYHIICLDDHLLVDLMQKQNISVLCLERKLGRKNLLLRNTSAILEHPLVLSFIKEKAKGQTPNILFFKPQKKLEFFARKNNFKLIANPSSINKTFEDKINFYKIARRENLPVLSIDIVALGDLDFNSCAKKFGLQFVIQFGFGWAGNTTFFVQDQKQLTEIQKKHGRKIVKVSRFVKGLTVLNNAVVLPKAVLQSSPAIQINSNSCLTSMPGGTGGRQWPAGISLAQEKKIFSITQKTGEIMRNGGYLGYFGLDFLIDRQTDEVFLSENNARLTASTSFYTQLELKDGQIPLLGYHLMAFLDQNLLKNLPGRQKVSMIGGSEIIARNIFSRPIEVSRTLPTGIYDKDFSLKNESYCLNKAGKDDFWLNVAGKGRIINPEIEMIKFNTYGRVCDLKGDLNKVFSAIVKKAQKLIKIKNV